MSGQNAGGSEGQPSTESTQGETDFVPKRAYEDVSRDMHRFKSKSKELEAKANEYETRLKQLEEEKMREQAQWKELYEREKQEREATERKAKERDEAYLTAVKKSALKTELGGRIKDQYLVHANVAGVEFNEDGTINQESLLKVANEFRKNHGELIPSVHNPEPTSQAAPTGQTVTSGEKPIEQMSLEEKIAALQRLK